jgi:hypothetical protein
MKGLKMCNRSSTKYMIYPSSLSCSLPSRYTVQYELRPVASVTPDMAYSLEVIV